MVYLSRHAVNSLRRAEATLLNNTRVVALLLALGLVACGSSASQGSPGPAGDAGATGATGPEGATGATGADGATGATGAIGPAGVDGASGAQGLPGAQGGTGPQGLQGLPGNNGAQGATGTIGATGAAGGSVTESVLGLNDPNCPAGGVKYSLPGIANSVVYICDGERGDAGPQGLQGLDGLRGATGAQGPTGAQGTQGIAGVTGATGFAGPTGAQGVQGIQGVQGASGVQGIQGIVGATGATGAQGFQGSQGSVGATGSIGVTGLAGATGASGAAGAKGATGATGTGLTISGNDVTLPVTGGLAIGSSSANGSKLYVTGVDAGTGPNIYSGGDIEVTGSIYFGNYGSPSPALQATTNSLSHAPELLSTAPIVGAASDTSGTLLRTCAGRTPTGSTNWIVYGSQIYVEVDMSGCKFSSTPYVVSSIGGTSSHWTSTGGSAPYSATATGFTIYVNQPGGVTPAQANGVNWHIEWIAVGN
jgi:hypothetical protein